MELVLGMDIGGTSIRVGLVDRELRLRDLRVAKQREVLQGGDAITALIAFVQAYLQETLGGDALAAICMGFPGVVDSAAGVVLSAPNICGVSGKPVGELFRREFLVPVVVEKDVNLLLFHDIHRLGLGDVPLLAGVYIGTGIGNAVCIGGEVLRGRHSAAGELGHIPFLEGSELCSCGGIGCSELYTGGKYLEKLCRERFPKVAIEKLFAEKGGTPEVAQYIRRVAALIAMEVNVLDPWALVVGGGVVAMQDFPKEALTQAIRRFTRTGVESGLRILYAYNSGENGVLGGAICAWRGKYPI